MADGRRRLDDNVLRAVHVDGFTATIARVEAAGLPDDAPIQLGPPAPPNDDGPPGARPVAALDVDFPVYDLALDLLSG